MKSAFALVHISDKRYTLPRFCFMENVRECKKERLAENGSSGTRCINLRAPLPRTYFSTLTDHTRFCATVLQAARAVYCWSEWSGTLRCWKWKQGYRKCLTLMLNTKTKGREHAKTDPLPGLSIEIFSYSIKRISIFSWTEKIPCSGFQDWRNNRKKSRSNLSIKRNVIRPKRTWWSTFLERQLSHANRLHVCLFCRIWQQRSGLTQTDDQDRIRTRIWIRKKVNIK